MPRRPSPRVVFYGVRGSTPCPSDALRRYGGNTSCVVIEPADQPPIVFDMGTGIREFGVECGPGPITASILVTHLHWDHVQGLPFFAPVHDRDSRVKIYGPPDDRAGLEEAFRGLMKPPYFPICCDELPEGVEFITTQNERLRIGEADVLVRSVPHTGATNGYRVEIDGHVITYVSDHQEPTGDATTVADEVLELCDGADLLIHDAQFTPAELHEKPHWGHSTARYALEVAAQSGAARLVLFHHDPGHDDDAVDLLLERTRTDAAKLDACEVFAAAEGTTLCWA